MPSLSVVIPTLGRAEALPRVLDRLAAQDPHEVVVVRDTGAGASAARNEGLRDATGDVVLFLGDDILPSPRLVAEHLEWHERHPEEEVGVLGHVRWARELRTTPFMRWLEHGIQFDYPSIQGEDAGWGRLYTANVSLKRAFVERAGGFDESIPYLYEDLDLGRRLHELGLRLLYNRRAEGEHLHAVTVESFRERMAKGAVAERRFVAKHPDVPPYFHDLFTRARAHPPARGRATKLLPFVPRGTPLIGKRIWDAADLYYRQQLADAFLDAWHTNVPEYPA